MFAIAGILLIAAAFWVGVPGKIYLDEPNTGQILLFAGVTPLAWAVFNANKKRLHVVPLPIGLFVAGYFGVIGQDIFGIVGGLMIVTFWGFAIWHKRWKSR